MKGPGVIIHHEAQKVHEAFGYLTAEAPRTRRGEEFENKNSATSVPLR